MKKLKKLTLDKKNITKLEDYELVGIEGGGSMGLVSCYLCTELELDNCRTTKTTTKRPVAPSEMLDAGDSTCVRCAP